MKKWIISGEDGDNFIFDVDGVELIVSDSTGSIIHFACGEKRWVKQAPSVLLSEIKRSDDQTHKLP